MYNRKDGLTAGEVRRMQEKYGNNELAQGKRESFARKPVYIICELMFFFLLSPLVL